MVCLAQRPPIANLMVISMFYNHHYSPQPLPSDVLLPTPRHLLIEAPRQLLYGRYVVANDASVFRDDFGIIHNATTRIGLCAYDWVFDIRGGAFRLDTADSLDAMMDWWDFTLKVFTLKSFLCELGYGC